jgi:hypothetical protein
VKLSSVYEMGRVTPALVAGWNGESDSTNDLTGTELETAVSSSIYKDVSLTVPAAFRAD